MKLPSKWLLFDFSVIQLIIATVEQLKKKSISGGLWDWWLSKCFMGWLCLYFQAAEYVYLALSSTRCPTVHVVGRTIFSIFHCFPNVFIHWNAESLSVSCDCLYRTSNTSHTLYFVDTCECNDWRKEAISVDQIVMVLSVCSCTSLIWYFFP